jgi:hypothetical protein
VLGDPERTDIVPVVDHRFFPGFVAAEEKC